MAVIMLIIFNLELADGRAMYVSDEMIPKYEIEVQIELDDGARLSGHLFARRTQRLSDLLNDPRRSLPFQNSGGTIVHLRKEAIAKVVEPRQRNEHDPRHGSS
jgi:hypothetical protein